MNNNNGMPGNAELIALANRRREQLRKAEEERRLAEQNRPRPQPQTTQPTQPEPQPQQHTSQPHPHPSDGERSKRAAEEAKRRQAEEAKRREAETRANAEAEKRKKAEEARVARDKAASERRKRRSARSEAIAKKISAFREENKNTVRDAFCYFIIFLCILLIICTASASVVLIRMLNYAEAPELPSRITVSIEGRKKGYDYEDIVRGGVYYIDFTSIAELCGLSQSGDGNIMIYSTADGEQIRFVPPPCRTVTVNGNPVTAEDDLIEKDGRIWAPLSLIRDYFLGIEIEIAEGKDEETEKPFITVTVSRVEEDDGYERVSFRLKNDSVILGIPNETLPPEHVILPTDAPQYEFTAKLSAYLKYMCPEDYDKHMILINPSHSVDETYIPENLVSVPNPRYDNGSSLCEDASFSLEALFLEMHELGFRDMKVSIAYRSYEQQKKQFDIYVYNERYYYRSHYETEGKWFSDEAYEVFGKEYLEKVYIAQGKTSLSASDAERVAMSYSAYPGTGDHQTGLALDLYLPGFTGLKFAETDEYKWLVDNAHKFGFIFRYPENKVNITGYNFEPVHLRFVGQYHAALIYESGLSLEEYVSEYIN